MRKFHDIENSLLALHGKSLQAPYRFNVADTISVVLKNDTGQLKTVEGLCIAKKAKGISSSFKIRRVTKGVAIEMNIPIHSPAIQSITVVRRGKARRAKLYYLRSAMSNRALVKSAVS